MNDITAEDRHLMGDFFPTDERLVKTSLNLIPRLNALKPNILDPGSGSGVWGKYCREKYPGSIIVGIEPRQIENKPDEYDYWIRHDFLTYDTQIKYDLIVCNPPYGMSYDGVKNKTLPEQFIHKAFSLLAVNGYMLFLVHLNLLAGINRHKNLWSVYPALSINLPVPRPSFTGNNKTEKAQEYMLVLWKKYCNGSTTINRFTWK
jgi:hypothetical protein